MKRESPFQTVIVTTNNSGYRWYFEGTVKAKGFFHDDVGDYYDHEKVCRYFNTVAGEDDFVKKLSQINGCFAVIINIKGSVLFAVDRLRTIPIFYSNSKGAYFIGDDAFDLQQQIEYFETSKVSVGEFLSAGFVIGTNTLNPRIEALQSGQYAVINDRTSKIEFYYKHLHGDYVNRTEEQYFEEIDEINYAVFNRLLNRLDGRQAVIPLSGGFDSRYILCMLRKLGYDNIATFTYGVSSSFEIKIAKLVAEKMGVKCHLFVFTDDIMKTMWSSPDFRKYNHFCCNLVSLPHYQEFLPVEWLRNKSLIDHDSVIIPGFCGDLLGGSQLPMELIAGKTSRLLSKGLLSHVLDNQMILRSFLRDDIDKEIEDHVAMNLQELGAQPCDLDEFISLNEAWFTNHKVSKYVVNSLRVYEFFDFSWAMPLWDLELINFWYRVPNKLRVRKSLYDHYLLEKLFRPLGVDFKHDGERGFLLNIVDRFPKIKFYVYNELRINEIVNAFLRPSHINMAEAICKFSEQALLSKGTKLPKAGHVQAAFAKWYLIDQLAISVLE